MIIYPHEILISIGCIVAVGLYLTENRVQITEQKNDNSLKIDMLLNCRTIIEKSYICTVDELTSKNIQESQFDFKVLGRPYTLKTENYAFPIYLTENGKPAGIFRQPTHLLGWLSDQTMMAEAA